MTIAITSFEGTAPRVDPRQLKPTMAQTAINCKLWSNLDAFREPLFIERPTKVGTKQTIHIIGQTIPGVVSGVAKIRGAAFNSTPINRKGKPIPEVVVPGGELDSSGGTWLHWLEDVNVARGFVQNDTSERVYFTGQGAPKVTNLAMAINGGTNYPMTWYDLGVPAPSAAPTTVLGSGGSGLATARSYVFTYVTGFGEESAPSAPSVILPAVLPGQQVTVTNVAVTPGGSLNITKWRIYRVVSGSIGAKYQFVTELVIGTTSYIDTLLNAVLGEVLPTIGWVIPNPNMKGLQSMPNGIMVGFFSNTLCFCEPFKPYAWPVKYQLTTEIDIISIGVYSGGILVTTARSIYICLGTDPSGMTLVPLDAPQICVAKRSMVGFEGGVIYASPDGLIVVNQGGAMNATAPYFSKDNWNVLKPSSMHGYILDGRYFCFYNTGIVSGGFIFDPQNQDLGLVFIDTYATAGYSDKITDALYLQIGTDIMKWDSHTIKKILKWKSKVFVHSKPVIMAYGQIKADKYPVTYTLYADGVINSTKSVLNKKPFRLPAGKKATEWEVMVETTNNIYSVYAAESMEALKNA